MIINKKEDIKIFKEPWTNSVEKIVVHHTAYLKSLKPKQFFSVNQGHKDRKFHKKSLGYYVGYTFIIEAKGEIRQGRAVGENTAAHFGYNTKFLAISFSGDYRFEKLSKEQIYSYVKLHRWLEELVETKLEITSHRELSNTVCSGVNVQQKELQDFVNDKDTADICSHSETIAKMQVLIDKLVSVIISLLRAK